jgi:aminopeptidase
MDPRVERLAEVMVDYSLALRKGDLFKIEAPHAAMPLVTAVYRRALARGAFPYVEFYAEEFTELLLRHGSDEQLDFVSPLRRAEFERIDARLYVMGSQNTKYLSHVDPSRQGRNQAARRELQEIFFRRTASKELRWCGTLFPTHAFAQDAGQSLTDYEDFVYGAGHCDGDGAIDHWRGVSKEQQKLVVALNRLRSVRVKSADTDLRLSVAGRPWINCDGRQNFPDGEVFTCPIESSAHGMITYSYPACFNGREVENVRLTFEDGVVTKFSAAKNEAYLREMLSVDDGARRLGEFAIGTNYQIQSFTKNVLFDEKIGGTCHLALGHSIYEAGGTNQSAIHWDMVCDLRLGGEIWGDDALIYRDGNFVAGFAA